MVLARRLLQQQQQRRMLGDWQTKYVEAVAAHDNLLKSIPKRAQLERTQALSQMVKNVNKVQNFCRASKVHETVDQELERVVLRPAGYEAIRAQKNELFDPNIHESISQVVEEANLAKSEVVVTEVHSVGLKNSTTGQCIVPATVSTLRRRRV